MSPSSLLCDDGLSTLVGLTSTLSKPVGLTPFSRLVGFTTHNRLVHTVLLDSKKLKLHQCAARCNGVHFRNFQTDYG